MKTLCLVILIILLLPINSFGLDGDISFGKFINSTLRANPGGEYTLSYAQYIFNIEIGHNLFKNKFRPYVRLETIMDDNENIFNPVSIKYDFGTRINIYKGLYMDLSHMCWHPINFYGPTEQYNLIKMGIKF